MNDKDARILALERRVEELESTVRAVLMHPRIGPNEKVETFFMKPWEKKRQHDATIEIW